MQWLLIDKHDFNRQVTWMYVYKYYFHFKIHEHVTWKIIDISC